ncbi:MAG: putative peptidoglycan glycosyltransferase FtsW [bacterium]|nr:putative peptidoglycan glycosyltransferase FtsW [bacterium]
MFQKIDKVLLAIILALLAFGFLIFVSASLGLLARDGASFQSVAGRQLLAIALGCGAAFGALLFNYAKFKRYALLILIVSVFGALLVYIPQIGLEHGGAKRWISVAGFSIQPSEFLKLGLVIFAAAFMSAMKERIETIKWGLVPLLLLIAVAAAILLPQPDTDSFVVIAFTLLCMYIAAGGNKKHIAGVIILGVLVLSIYVISKPYLIERFFTFLNPARDPQGSGWQIQQSLIAIGSGGFLGRGFGQSVQKFSYLPEPIDDSIFAVMSEEFGFVGSSTLVLLFLLFILRGLRNASRAPDLFGRLLCIGIVILIGSGAFMNIAAMLGIIPLSGLPLPFVSHGGTALIAALFSAGILLSISRYQRS